MASFFEDQGKFSPAGKQHIDNYWTISCTMQAAASGHKSETFVFFENI